MITKIMFTKKLISNFYYRKNDFPFRLNRVVIAKIKLKGATE